MSCTIGRMLAIDAYEVVEADETAPLECAGEWGALQFAADLSNDVHPDAPSEPVDWVDRMAAAEEFDRALEAHSRTPKYYEAAFLDVLLYEYERNVRPRRTRSKYSLAGDALGQAERMAVCSHAGRFAVEPKRGDVPCVLIQVPQETPRLS